MKFLTQMNFNMKSSIAVKVFFGLASVLALSSCKDFLTADPIDRVSAGTYFRTESDLELYANGLVYAYRPSGESVGKGDNYTDLICTQTSTDFYRPGIWNSVKQGGWDTGDWKGIRRANKFIEGIESNRSNLKDESIINHYLGVARFWRAYFYFAKVKTFSDVPWIDHVVTVDDPILTAGRDDRELVMHHVLEDLDFACENLSADKKLYGRVINKYVALALKSRICLYEGSFRKYHAVNPATNVAWNGQYESSDKFFEEAASAAKQLMDSKEFALVSGSPVSVSDGKEVSSVYDQIWRGQDFSKTSEAIWTAEYEAGELNVYNELTWVVNSSTYDQKAAPTKNLVRMFLTLEGTPAKGDVSLTKEFDNRDWRLYNTVHGPGHMYTTNAGETLPKKLNFTYTFSGYMFRKWSQEKEENYSKGRNDNDIPIIRYPEVLLNYAEAKAELGQMDETIWNETVGALRQRAGVKNIYPESAGYVEDAWLKAYYHNPSLSNVLLEIRRERVTELICESLRPSDLERWCCSDLIVDRGTGNTGWMGIYITKDEYKNGFKFNGETYTFKAAKNSANSYKTGTSTADQNITLSEGDHGYLIYNYKLEWNDRNYVRPIPATASTKNPNLGQNYGWED